MFGKGKDEKEDAKVEPAQDEQAAAENAAADQAQDEDAAEQTTESGAEHAGASADGTESNAEGTADQAKTEDTPEAKIAALEKENADLKDQLLRRAADFDNYRKRMMQEKQDAFDYGNANLLKDLLDSLDNFDRTVEAASTASDAKSIADGVTMINKSLVSMLENKYNLAAYGAVGDAFDPDIHEAIGKVDEPVAEPTVKAVYLKGYKLKDRVIRHAKVMVSMPDGSVKDKEAEPAAEDKSENNEQ